MRSVGSVIFYNFGSRISYAHKIGMVGFIAIELLVQDL